MHVWRLTRAEFGGTPFDGVGPARGGGRWNCRGTYIAYAASSRSLAILEVLVHIDRDLVPRDLVFIEAEVPDDAIAMLDAKVLPPSWRTEPPPPALRDIGDAWARATSSLALRVPSVVVPEEENLLVNPSHPRFAELRVVGSPKPVSLDPRLW